MSLGSNESQPFQCWESKDQTNNTEDVDTNTTAVQKSKHDTQDEIEHIELKEVIDYSPASASVKNCCPKVNYVTGDIEDEERSQTMFLTDGNFRIDYVLVWCVKREEHDNDEEVRSNFRSVFEQNLKDEGLQLEHDIQESRDIQYTKIYAPFEVLSRYAEIMKYRMPITQHADTGTHDQSLLDVIAKYMSCFLRPFQLSSTEVPPMPKKFTHVYERNKEYLYCIPSVKDEFFSHAQRSSIVNYILRRKSYTDDADEKCKYGTEEAEDAGCSGINQLLADEVYVAAYPLHEGSVDASSKMSIRKLLKSQWASWRMWYKMQPLDYIRVYFGEKIGLYFAWLGYYTRWLIPASVVGLLVFIYGVATITSDVIVNESCDETKNFTMCPICSGRCGYWSYHQNCVYVKVSRAFDNDLTFFFAIFMSLWGTLYLEFWKRKQLRIQFRWNVTNFEKEEEPPRPEYLVHLAKSKYRKAPAANLTTVPHLPFWRRQVPVFAVSFVSALFLCLCAVGVVVGILFYRMSVLAALHLYHDPRVSNNAALVVSVTGACINVIAVFILHFIYRRLAVLLTDWECRRTQTDYDDSMALKLYFLQFVNYYSSLFYIAFFMSRFVGTPAKYKTFAGARQEECQGGCMAQLCIQFAVTFIGIQIIKNNLVEMCLPRLIAWLKRRFHDDENLPQNLSPWEQDYHLADMGPMGLFNEYLEIILQFGFVTLFVAAFPLAPIFAVINNIVELRGDANKFVTRYRRPTAARASDIGIWSDLLHGLSRLAIVTNALIIAFTSQFIDRVVYKYHYSGTGTLEGFVNNSLSYFNVSDFPASSGPLTEAVMPEYNGTILCRYLEYRYPPWSEDKYEYTTQHWHIVAVRFIFVVCFENCVLLMTSLVAYVIPDVPFKLQKQMRHERQLTNRKIIKTELERARGHADPVNVGDPVSVCS